MFRVVISKWDSGETAFVNCFQCRFICLVCYTLVGHWRQLFFSLCRCSLTCFVLL